MSVNNQTTQPPQQTTTLILNSKGTLKNHINTNTMIDKITNEIKSYSNYNTLKLDLELTEAIIRMLHTIYKKTTTKDEKINILITVLTNVFYLSDEEIRILKNQIDYIYHNKTYKTAKNFFNSLWNKIKPVIFKKTP